MFYPVLLPYPQFTDLLGCPLQNGKVYIGSSGQNPETNPIAIYWDEAGTQPAAQPLRTKNGYIYRNGLPAVVYVSTDFSMTVRTSNSELIFYTSTVLSTASVLDKLNNTSNVSLGDALVGVKQPLSNAAARNQHLKNLDIISLKDYEDPALPLGVNSQTLYSYSYSSDISQQPVSFTQQTADGIALIKALADLKALYQATGVARALFIPAGIYRIYGYITRIDFPVKIYGEGIDVTILKSCDNAPTLTAGYGIFLVQPASYVGLITLDDMTLDGNCASRTDPAHNETRAYPIAVYGYAQCILNRIKSINSIIDCLYTDYVNDTTSGRGGKAFLITTDCILDKSYRNTFSLVGGSNQTHNNLTIKGGGLAYTPGGAANSGTSPRACLDIEPDFNANVIYNVIFNGGLIENSSGTMLNGTTANNIQFNGTIVNAYNSLDSSTAPAWGQFHDGIYTFNGCQFIDRITYNNSLTGAQSTTGGTFTNSSKVTVKSSEFIGGAFLGLCNNVTLKNTEFSYSLFPLWISQTVDVVDIDNVTLKCVIDKNNIAGVNSSFTVTTLATVSALLINDVKVLWDATGIAQQANDALFNVGSSGKAYGVSISPTFAAGGYARVTNVHSSGFYKKYPSYFSLTQGANFKDWGTATSFAVPVDTSGQTTVPGVTYYKGCTEYGNNV